MVFNLGDRQIEITSTQCRVRLRSAYPECTYTAQEVRIAPAPAAQHPRWTHRHANLCGTRLFLFVATHVYTFRYTIDSTESNVYRFTGTGTIMLYSILYTMSILWYLSLLSLSYYHLDSTIPVPLVRHQYCPASSSQPCGSPSFSPSCTPTKPLS